MRRYPGKIGAILKKLRSARDELHVTYPDHPFTLDGNLIGDIGEAIAIIDFSLKKLDPGSKLHDCKTRNGKRVQVKTTQQTVPGKGVGLGLTKRSFKHLLVVQLLDDGYEILYDGPGRYVNKKRKGKKSPSLSVKQLGELDTKVKPDERLS
ncbi:MAG: DUF6998 domain-containing protein [Limisphaerales bacterium]